jgi:hypothetical protein
MRFMRPLLRLGICLILLVTKGLNEQEVLLEEDIKNTSNKNLVRKNATAGVVDCAWLNLG